MGNKQPSGIERLEKAIADAKEETRIAHEAIADLKREIREARAVQKDLNDFIDKIFEDSVAHHLTGAIEEIVKVQQSLYKRVNEGYERMGPDFLDTLDKMQEHVLMLDKRHRELSLLEDR